ncbi:MAG: SIR2 family protein [Fimbriimonadaceae bacterium]
MFGLTRSGVAYARELAAPPESEPVVAIERPEEAVADFVQETARVIVCDIGVPHNRVLLTGAGFSYAFGGKLVSEFQSAIFNQRRIYECPELRDLTSKVPSFEEALAVARAQNLSTEVVQILETAIRDVFLDMDRDMQSNQSADGEVDLHLLQDFLNRFAMPQPPVAGANAGYVFTLNQDLLGERKWYEHGRYATPIGTPGVAIPPAMYRAGHRWFSQQLGPYEAIMEAEIGDLDSLTLTGQTNYIKLHGSFNWRRSDGSSAMVLGSGKAQQIGQISLLQTYLDIFRRVLLRPGMKLMVFGYSFGDPHINDILVEAVENGLKLHVWDIDAWGIERRLREHPTWSRIDNGVECRWVQKLHRVFPAGDHPHTSEWRQIQERFFED